ncbi:MAG: diphthine synthase [Candidatus Wolframiiraptor sp. EX4484-121]|nr:MAG: diphthine synthase [Candidatus Wolframiiraptor sp. EX4484-121]
MPIHLIGLGLGTIEYLTLGALETAERMDELLLDTYTSWIHPDLMKYLREKFGERLVKADRSMLEERVDELIRKAEEKEIGILVPGDPLIATTHISIILEARRRKIPVYLIYGVSIISASASASGLQAYKFGRITTIPRDGVGVETCYRVVAENLEKGLHSLILLDTADGGLKIPDALKMLMRVEDKLGYGIFDRDSMVICLARIGSSEELRWAGRIIEALKLHYPPPPHLIIVPGELHFAEVEALKEILGADEELVESYKPPRYERERARSYIMKVERVLDEIRIRVDSERVMEIIEIVKSYLEDSKKFLENGEVFNAVAAISYAEGLLDSLRNIGYVDFEWPRT